MQIIDIDGFNALCEAKGVRREASLYLLQGEEAFRTGVVLYDALSGPVTGDYNHDGVVNLADYTVWRDHLGATVPSGTSADGNNDGLITSADYTIWKNNFGASPGALGIGTQSASVPEPSALLLSIIALGGTLHSVRRRARIR